GWRITSGTGTFDAHGQLATLSGEAATNLVSANIGNGDDSFGIRTIPKSGTLTIKCNAPGPVTGLRLIDETGTGSIAAGAATPQPDDPVSGKKVFTLTYAMREFDPATGVTAGLPYFPKYEFAMSLRVTSVITDVEVYEGTPPAAGDPMTHPVTLDR